MCFYRVIKEVNDEMTPLLNHLSRLKASKAAVNRVLTLPETAGLMVELKITKYQQTFEQFLV